MPRIFFRKEFWLHFIVGAVCGLAYVWVDVGVLDESSVSHGALSVAHEMFDTIIPVLAGVSIALGVFFLRQISRLNKRLSLKKEQLQKELLFNTLISQMFHEIQGPIHNISAALEDSEKELTAEKAEVIRRNLDRLAELKKQYSEKNSGLDTVDPQEPMLFKKWLTGFVEDKVRSHMERAKIRYQESVDPVVLNIHPMLMEQILLTLFSNAFEALETVPPEQRELFLKAGGTAGASDQVQIMIRNRGSFFPQDALQKQGRRLAESRHGFGLGLLLVNRMLEQVGGKLRLENAPDGAVVTMTLPGGRA